jgi:hypothetical protein
MGSSGLRRTLKLGLSWPFHRPVADVVAKFRNGFKVGGWSELSETARLWREQAARGVVAGKIGGGVKFI